MSLFSGSQSKMTKIQNSLLDLNKEISTTAKFLQQLRQHSVKIVRNLNNVTSYPVYLKQYIQVNSFLLKYLSVLTEMNCKFEMMQLLEAAAVAKNDQNKRMEKTVASNLDLVHQMEGIESNSSKQAEDGEKINQNLFVSGETCLEKTFPQKNEAVCTDTQVKDITKSFCSLNTGKQDDSKFNFNSCTEQTLVPGENAKTSKECKDNNGSETPKIEENLIQKASADSQQKSLMPDSKSEDANSDTNSIVTCSDFSRPSSIEFLPTLQSTLTEDHIQGSRSVLNKPVSSADANKEKVTNPDKNFEIEPLNIPHKTGDEFEVLVQYIKSPSEFYVHVINQNLEMLCELENKLKLFSVENQDVRLPKKENKKLSMSKEIGTFALYYSKCDEVWFRAKVNNWCIGYNDNLVNIFLIDYGEYKCVDIETLQPMPDFLKKYPSFAIRCHLHKVFPVDDVEKSKSLFWGRASTEEMKRLIENSNSFKMTIAPNDFYHPPDSWPVILWMPDEINESLNKSLVTNKFAIESPGDEKVDSTENSHVIESLENWNPMKEDYESYQNNYEFDVRDPAAVIYGYVGHDYERICSQFWKTGHCFKKDACRKEHRAVDPRGYTTDQEEIYKSAFNPLPAPAVHETLSVLVTCILGVNQFCCIREPSSWDSEEETLTSLLKFMNQAENIKEMKKLLIPPAVGQIVIAQFSEDNCWYRAKILESQPESDSYSLMFVDYGNKETVSLARIRAIEPRYLHLPFQLIQCFVFGIEKNPQSSMIEVIDCLNKRMGEEHVTIEVVSKFPGDDCTLLVNVFDEKGTNIAEELLTKGIAIYKQEILLSSENEALPG